MLPDKDYAEEYLLAIDAGIRTGLALYEKQGRLLWYRSKNFGSMSALRRGVATLLRDIPGPARLVVEGGGPQAEAWQREASRLGMHCCLVSAETWRNSVLLTRHRSTGTKAKHFAGKLARVIIGWSQARKSRALRHDAAEAICLGFWAVMDIGWLDARPLEDKSFYESPENLSSA